jgi:hypothetical protein
MEADQRKNSNKQSIITTMKWPKPKSRLEFIHGAGFLFCLSVVLTLVFLSFFWKIEHDSPLMHYAGFLMNEGHRIPYRDFFTFNMPGTLLFHSYFTYIFGYGDLAFRVVDLMALFVLSFCSYTFMRRFGKLPAFWSVILFALLYLSHGQIMSLQRDYIALVPMALTLLFIPDSNKIETNCWKLFFVGLLFGIAAIIKPHLAAGVFVFFILFARQNNSLKKTTALKLIPSAAAMISGILIPICACFIWLYLNHALADFFTIFSQYVPKYNQLSGKHESLATWPHIAYLFFKTINFDDYGPLLLASLFSFIHCMWNKSKVTHFSSAILIYSLSAVYALVPLLAGKFWNYHYIPFMYFCSLSVSLCTCREFYPEYKYATHRALPGIFLLCAVVFQQPLQSSLHIIYHQCKYGVSFPKAGRVSNLSRWLKEHLKPGDKVQPLDWTGGAVHAMLNTRAELATSFYYDFYFYHHLSTPYIQKLRNRFIKELKASKPRYIIDIQTEKPWVTGMDTSTYFADLTTFIKASYTISYTGRGCFIYERKAKKSTAD